MAKPLSEKDFFIKSIIMKLHCGELMPDERLPAESELAEQYGISKTTIHLAIQQLERLGFVRVIPRHAVYINSPEQLTLESLDAMFNYLDELPQRPVVEAMLELRHIMGIGVIHWTVHQPSAEHLQKLHELLDALEATVDNEDCIARENALGNLLDFIYSNSGNLLFTLLAQSAHDTMRVAIRYISEYADPHEMIQVYRSMERHLRADDTASAVEVWVKWNEKITQAFLKMQYGDA